MDGVPVAAARMHMPLPQWYQEAYEVDRFRDHVPVDRISMVKRLVVLESHRGGIVPLKMMIAMYQELLRRDTALILLDCLPHLVRLYERLGFRTYLPFNIDDPGGSGMLTAMALVPNDMPRLRSVRSPLLSIARRHYGDAEPPGWADSLFAAPGLGETDLEEDALEWARGYKVAVENRVARYGFFHELEPGQIERLISQGVLIKARRGDAIQHHGVATGGYGLGVIREGKVEVRRMGRLLGTLGPGEVFGAVEAVLETPPLVDISAASDTVEVVLLGLKTFERLGNTDPTLLNRILLNLSRLLSAALVTQVDETH
jgi:hypothetical protein